MRRYLIVGAIAEAVGIALLFFAIVLFQGPHRLSFSNSLGYLMGPKFACKNPSAATVRQINDLAQKGMNLSFDLDILDDCVPFVVGFPAVAVFALWTIDRQQKSSAKA